MSDRALLLGINEYDSISHLRGCLNDVESVHTLLVDQFGFAADGIVKLVDGEVVKKQILKEFKKLAAASKPGDRLVFHYSGHGSYIPSEDGDEAVDELICLYDMDWDAGESYFVDDDLGKLFRTVPSGVQLTVILDCCHSGSGTRMVERPGARSVKPGPKAPLMIVEDTARTEYNDTSGELTRALQRGEVAPKHPVYARFVMPPRKHRRTEQAMHRLRSLGESASDLNHLLLAGAADTQTAADAFIGGDYQGAFTYYLCEAARRSGSGASAATVFKAAQQSIKQHQYSQDPQLEGPGSNAPLFGKTGGDDAPSVPDPGTPNLSDFLGGIEREEGDLVPRLVDLAKKFLEVFGDREGPGDGVPGGDRAQREEWVAVHGISRHRAGYSERWWQAMRPYLSKPLNRTEVLWSHHVNPRALSQGEEMEDAKFRAAIEAVLEERLAQDLQDSGATEGLTEETVPADALAGERGAGLALDDFVRYMFDRGTRERILFEFTSKVEPLLRARKRLHVVSHSWGTVVAYEGLRRLEAAGHPGRVQNFFVVGSALSIGPVRRNLFSRVTDGRKPAMVNRFLNLDAKGDHVGGGLRPHFAVNHPEFVNLDAVGCSRFWPFPPGLGCSHSSYFDSNNVTTNRDIFARFINAG